MIYTITVLGQDGAPLPGAKVVFGARDGYGTPLNLVADKNGVVSIDDSVTGDLSTTAVYWTTSSPGYQTYTWYNDEGFTGNKTVTLIKSINTEKALLVGAGVGLGLLYLSAQGNKKKVSGVDFKKDVAPYIVPGVLLVGGVYVIHKVLQSVGLTPSVQDLARDAALNSAISAAGSPTLSAIQISTIADQLKEDLSYSSISNDTTDAVTQFSKMNNLADVLALIQAYGKHWITFFGIPRGTYTLEETVTSQLGADNIATVNQDWAGKGINFKF